MPTNLYERVIAYDYGDKERNDLAREVWAPTPWMIDVYTGSFDDGRSYDILHWLHDEFGPESSPIHGRTGHWHRGGATINGWAWIGFSSENHMHCFMGAWPAPAGITHPDQQEREI